MPRRQDDHVSGRSASWRPHDTDRSIDPFDPQARSSSRPPSARPPVPPSPSRPAAASPARGSAADGSRGGAAGSTAGAASSRLPAGGGGSRPARLRTALLGSGAVLAVGSTLVVFLTDDPGVLRVAVVAATWAFVLATFVAGRRGSDEAAVEQRETALRRAYEHQLEREVAARREYELELENELRREAEEAMRGELDALREDLAGLSALREEVARVAELKDDVAVLSALRDEVARVAALRDDVLALTALRTELGQVGELRADLGRLRAELTEQLSSEMLVERIIMRTQASRLTGEQGRLDPAPAWREEPARELTGGWPAARLDEAGPRAQPATQQYPAHQPATRQPVTQQPVTQQYPSLQQYEQQYESTQHYQRVRVDRPVHSWEPSTGGIAVPAAASAPDVPPSAPVAGPPPPMWTPAPPPTGGYGSAELPARRSRHATAADDDAEPLPIGPPPSPVEWLAARSLLDAPATAERPPPAPRLRRTDDDEAAPLLLPPRPDDQGTAERHLTAPASSAGHPSGSPAPLPEAPVAEPQTPPGPGQVRVDQILADSGVTPATGSRRRRRYREDDGSDDVLARVLRGG